MNKLWIAFGLGMGISSAAWADVAGDQLYVALDGGNASYRDFCTGTGQAGVCQNNDRALRIAAGYSFTPMWGIELSYADLGRATFNGTFRGLNSAIKYSATAFEFSGTGTFALNDTFALLGKLGIVQSDTNFDLLTPGAAASTSVSTARTTLGYGLGGQFNFDRHTGLRVQYEHLGNFGDATTIITSTVRLVSAGFIYHF